MKFTGGKDTDRYFLENLDDRELFTVMQTNKEYLKLGQDFFEKRMKKRYPILASRKPEDVTWFKYYIDNVFYISKLKEDYDLDYYNVPSFYPKTIYHRLYYYPTPSAVFKKIINYKISFLVENEEYEKVIKYLDDLNFDDLILEREDYTIFLLSQLLKVGNIPLFEKMANKFGVFEPYENLILINGATESGKEEVVNYIISHSNLVSDEIFYTGISSAIKSGNLKMINYFIKKYPEEKFDWVPSIQAIDGENLKIFKDFFKKDLEKGEIFDLMKRYAIIWIIQEGKLDFLKYVVEMYKLHGGDIKDLIKNINHQFKYNIGKKILDHDIRRYIKDLEKSLKK